MNLITILDTYKETLRDSTEIKSWCNTNYSTYHTIYKGVDLRKPPNKDECPLIAIVLRGKEGGQDVEQVIHTLDFVCQLYDETKTSTVTSDITVVEYAGINRIEAFRKLVETVIVGVISLVGLRVSAIKTDFEVLDLFPFFQAIMEVTFIEEMYLGDTGYE